MRVLDPKNKVVLSEPSCKRVKELEASLMTTQESLQNRRLKDLTLTHELDKARDVGLTFMSDSFENTLRKVEYFYLSLCISREKVHPMFRRECEHHNPTELSTNSFLLHNGYKYIHLYKSLKY